jgi:5-methylcytosine-specific restriction endonuclease McrA
MPRPRPTIEKNCPKCGGVKLLACFYASENYDGGYSTYCIPCISENNKKNREKYRERNREYVRKRYKENESVRDKIRRNAKASRERAKKNPALYRARRFFEGKRDGIAVDVTIDFIESLFLAATECKCCGKKLAIQLRTKDSKKYRSDPDGPSIDRVNNSKGYTRKNIAVICWECNFRKTDLTLEDLAMMIDYVKRNGEF